MAGLSPAGLQPCRPLPATFRFTQLTGYPNRDGNEENRLREKGKPVILQEQQEKDRRREGEQ